MNELEARKIPKFLEGEPLPTGYFQPIKPYASAPTCKINIGKLVAYAKAHGKTQWELTKKKLECSRINEQHLNILQFLLSG